MNLVNVLIRFNQLLWYFCSFPHIQYRHPPSHLPSQKKKSAVSKTLFLLFHLRCCTDRIPHSLIFKRMHIRRIANSFRAFSFLLTNWNKEPDEERIYRWTEFFHKLDNKTWKMRTCNKTKLSIYISLYMKTFLKTGVYIYVLCKNRKTVFRFFRSRVLDTLK